MAQLADTSAGRKLTGVDASMILKARWCGGDPTLLATPLNHAKTREFRSSCGHSLTLFGNTLFAFP